MSTVIYLFGLVLEHHSPMFGIYLLMAISLINSHTKYSLF